MLDYLEIRGNSTYSKRIRVVDFDNKIRSRKMYVQTGNCYFEFIVGDIKWMLRGILADGNGNYNYDSDHEFVEINLIEVDFPCKEEGSFHGKIVDEIFAIAELLDWEVYDPETEQVLKS